MNAEYRGRGISIAFAIRSVDPLPHIIQECPAADSQAQYTAKPILPLVLAELNSYQRRYFDRQETSLDCRPIQSDCSFIDSTTTLNSSTQLSAIHASFFFIVKPVFKFWK